MDAMDRRTTLVVLSDHGFELGRLQDDPSKTRDMRRVSEAFHRIEGILYLYGYRVKARTRIQRPTILDIAPTVLALNGLGRGADMPGRVLNEALDITVPAPVPTYETGPAASAQNPAPADPQADPEIVKKLQSLGYIGAKSPDGRPQPRRHADFEAGRYAEAAGQYEKLVKADPKDSGLRASYAGALGALGRYDAALEQLDAAIALAPVNVEAYHNRAVVHERRQERDAAIRDYQTAVQYNPQYEPSRAALARLGAPLPQAPEERRGEAGHGARRRSGRRGRRGDYAEAASEARRGRDASRRDWPCSTSTAPTWRTSRATAPGRSRALQAGLKLEPDNALFRKT